MSAQRAFGVSLGTPGQSAVVVVAAPHTFYCTNARCDSHDLPFEVGVIVIYSSKLQDTRLASQLVSGGRREALHFLRWGVRSNQQRARLHGKEASRGEEAAHPENALLLQHCAHVHGHVLLHVLDGLDQLLVELAEEALVVVELLE